MNDILLRLAVTLVGTGDQVNISGKGADQVLQNGLNIAYGLAGTIAIIVIIIGGIMYATAAGEAGNITKAKNLIFYSVAGLVVVLAAFAITNFVLGQF
jgi:type IV secretory pathway VirB2 component (pilin)